eukprot:COSAG01_NODE_62295_length_285_cov_0.935484_1_plen_95_part_11
MIYQRGGAAPPTAPHPPLPVSQLDAPGRWRGGRHVILGAGAVWTSYPENDMAVRGWAIIITIIVTMSPPPPPPPRPTPPQKSDSGSQDPHLPTLM